MIAIGTLLRARWKAHEAPMASWERSDRMLLAPSMFAARDAVEFTLGLCLGNAQSRYAADGDVPVDRTIDYVMVLDSPTMRIGWMFAYDVVEVSGEP